LVFVRAQLLDDRVRAPFAGCRNIEDIPGHDIGTPIKDLLSYNLSDGFQLNDFALDFASYRWRGSQGACNDEVDLTNTKDQFQGTNSVAFIVVRLHCKFEILFLGIEKRKLLRVIEKNIDVVAFAMVNLQHQRRTASNRPVVDDNLFRVNLSNEVACYAE